MSIIFHSLSLIDQDEKGKFVLYMFGRTIEGQSICVRIIDFTPYFYISKPPEMTPDGFKEIIIKYIEEYVLSSIDRGYLDREYINPLCTKRINYEKRVPFNKYQGEGYYRLMLRVSFNGHNTMKKVAWNISQDTNRQRIREKLERSGYMIPRSFVTSCSVYDEVKFDSRLKLCHHQDISPCGWIQIDKYRRIDSPVHSNQEIEIECSFKDLIGRHDITEIPKVVRMSYDLECYSDNYMMPQAKIPSNEIIQIGATFRIYGQNESIKKYIICQKECGDLPTAKDVIPINCENERELLIKFGQVIRKMNPDLVYGYNTFGFDDEYFDIRLKRNRADAVFSKLTSRSKHIFGQLCLAGSPDQEQVPKYYMFPGRITMDVLPEIKNNPAFKFPSYSLDYVSSYFLKAHKNDVDPHQIFDYYHEGDPEKIGIIADYCIQDCELVHRLVDHLSYVPGNIGMSRVNHIPYQYVVLRGQGIKILSNVGYNMMRGKSPKFILEITKYTKQDKYGGAVVLPPKCGIYTEYLVSVGDFSSLYPSIMIAHNMSQDTIVDNPQIITREGKEKFEEMFFINNITGEKTTVIFKRSEYGVGLLCNILKELLDSRKKVRLNLYTINDHITIIKEIAEGLKTGENVSEVITRLRGSSLLECNQDFVKEFKITDLSKSGYTLKYNGRTSVVEFTTMDKLLISLKGEATVFDAMQLAYKITANSVYGQCGAPTSAIYKREIAACTTTWGQRYIKMARDYGEKEYNTECIYGDSVTGDTPLLIRYSDGTIDIKTIETLSDDWIEYKNFKPGEPDRKDKQQASVDLQVWSNGCWADIKRVIRHKTNKQLFRVNTYKGCVDVTEDHSLLTDKGDKIKPVDCKIGTKLLHSFPRNISQLKISKAYKSKSFESKIEAQKAYCWYKSLGADNLTIEFVDNKYVIHEHENISNSIRKIFKLRNTVSDIFVYDLETSEGKFHAGVGECVVKNTDSAFFRFPYKIKSPEHKLELLNRVYKESQKMYKEITELIGRPPMKLAYEKIIAPLILMGKKNYCGLWHEEDMTKPKFKMMGCKAKKREYAPIVEKMFMDSVNKILYAENYQMSLREAWKRFYGLCKTIDKFPLKYFILTKKLGCNYKNPMSVGHKVLADRIATRDPGKAPKPGQRIPMIFIKVDPWDCEEHMFTKGGLAKFKRQSKALRKDDVRSGFKMETPDYIREKQLIVDHEHYILKQLATPMVGMYRLALPLDVIEYVFRDILDHDVQVRLLVEETEGYGGDKAIKEKAELKLVRKNRNKIYHFTKEDWPYINFVRSLKGDLETGKVVIE